MKTNTAAALAAFLSRGGKVQKLAPAGAVEVEASEVEWWRRGILRAVKALTPEQMDELTEGCP